MKKFALALALCAGFAHAKDTDLKCLAKNIYYEARGESLQGKLAVAQVTLNRQRDPRWQGSICKVVYQPWQFSWTHQYLQAPQDLDQWIESLEIAHRVLQRGWALHRFPATHYHNQTVSPEWRLALKPVKKIGQHTFYM